MIRQMKPGEEDQVRALYAKLSFENQAFWREQTKPLKDYLTEARGIRMSGDLQGKNVILVAEQDEVVVGFCWCSIVNRGVDKQAEIAELYVDRKYRGKGVGEELLVAAKQLLAGEHVDVAFVWAHQGNKEAIELYRRVGFKEVDQLVLAFDFS
jgi:ribosomal protein S18 acetylase RimI-like enzyme